MSRYFVIALHGDRFSLYWAEKPTLVPMDQATRYESLEKADEALQLVPIFTDKNSRGEEYELMAEILPIQTP